MQLPRHRGSGYSWVALGGGGEIFIHIPCDPDLSALDSHQRVGPSNTPESPKRPFVLKALFLGVGGPNAPPGLSGRGQNTRLSIMDLAG